MAEPIEAPTTTQVRRLIADQVPVLAGETVRPLTTPGTTNTIYRVGCHHVARFPQSRDDPDSAAEDLRKELRSIGEFHRATSVPSPRPVHLGEPAHGYSLHWSVLTWLPGLTADPHSHATNLVLARDLARLIQELRDAGTAGAACSGTGRGGRLSDHDDWVELCIKKSWGLLDTGALTAAWSRMRQLTNRDDDVMSHTDLIPANLIVTDGHLAGVLDSGGYQPADPALDLVCAWHLFDEPARTVLRTALKADEELWARAEAWAFQQAVGLVWYYNESNPHMADLGRTTLSRILAHGG